jgi:hypothetical protein
MFAYAACQPYFTLIFRAGCAAAATPCRQAWLMKRQVSLIAPIIRRRQR